MPEPDAAQPEHRVLLVQPPHVLEQHAVVLGCSLRRGRVLGERDLDRQLGEVGQELVQRRVDQPDRDRQAVHRLEDLDEVLALQRQQRLERALWLSSSSATISRSTSSRRSPRNMCSVRHSPMPWAPNRRARAESSGVSALARTRSRRAPSAWAMIRPTAATRSSSSFSPSKWRTTTDVGHRHLAGEHLAGGPVDRDHVALADGLAVADAEPCGFASTSSASAPHTQVRPMPRATTAAWEVLPPRLVRMPARRPCRAGRRGWSPCAPGSRPRRARPTPRPCRSRRPPCPRPRRGRRSCRVAIRVRSASSSKRGNISCASWAPVTRQHRLVEVDQPLVDHVDRDPERRLRGALADPGLEHPELAALDGELDVAHVAVVALEPGHDPHQVVVASPGRPSRSRPARPCCGCRRRRPRPARSGGSRRRRPARRWPGRA